MPVDGVVGMGGPLNAALGKEKLGVRDGVDGPSSGGPGA
jgi:hypothetical protein